MSANPKRHHYLPEFYLHGFTRDHCLWLYDRDTKQYRRQTPRNTAIIGHYYAFANEKGERDYSVEKFLSVIEGKAKQAISKLEARDPLTPEERLYLAHFIALLMVRTPRFHREANQIADAAAKQLVKHAIPTVEAAAQLLRQHGKAGRESGITPESMFEFIHNEEFTMELNRDFVINAMLDQAQKVTLQLAMMDWLVAHAAERRSFITTDAPLGYVVAEELVRSGEPVLGLASEKVTKLVPLTQTTALLAGRISGGFGHIDFSREQVKQFNISIAVESERYVIGRDETLVRNVVRWSEVDRKSPATRMLVEHIAHPTDPSRTFMVTRRVASNGPARPLRILPQ